MDTQDQSLQPEGVKNQEHGYIVEGFQFETLRDAQLAFREQNNINVLKGKIDFNNIEDMTALYCRLVERKVFKTPVGYQFLGEFREYLAGEGNVPEEDLPYVQVWGSHENNRMEREQIDFLQQENRKLETGRRYYIIAIAILVLLIVAMFVTTALNPNVGYINTENKILNRYASWEEDLTRREEAVRAKEAELGIEPEDTGEDTESGDTEQKDAEPDSQTN